MFEFYVGKGGGLDPLAPLDPHMYRYIVQTLLQSYIQLLYQCIVQKMYEYHDIVLPKFI